MGTILSFSRRPRLRSAQLRVVDEIRVVATQSHQIELLVDFRERVDGVAFLRGRDARWWVGGVPTRVVRVETARFIDQVRVVLEPEDITNQRFFGSVDWKAEIPDEFSQDLEAKPEDFNQEVHEAEVSAAIHWLSERSVELHCSGHDPDQGLDLIASVVHPNAVAAGHFNARSHQLRTGRSSVPRWSLVGGGFGDGGPSAA